MERVSNRFSERGRMMGAFLTMATLSRISTFVEQENGISPTASLTIMSCLFVLVVLVCVYAVAKTLV